MSLVKPLRNTLLVLFSVCALSLRAKLLLYSIKSTMDDASTGSSAHDAPPCAVADNRALLQITALVLPRPGSLSGALRTGSLSQIFSSVF